jgi:hypothetical protein
MNSAAEVMKEMIDVDNDLLSYAGEDQIDTSELQQSDQSIC